MTTTDQPRRLAIQLIRTADALEDRLDNSPVRGFERIEDCHQRAWFFNQQAIRHAAVAADATQVFADDFTPSACPACGDPRCEFPLECQQGIGMYESDPDRPRQ